MGAKSDIYIFLQTPEYTVPFDLDPGEPFLLSLSFNEVPSVALRMGDPSYSSSLDHRLEFTGLSTTLLLGTVEVEGDGLELDFFGFVKKGRSNDIS